MFRRPAGQENHRQRLSPERLRSPSQSTPDGRQQLLSPHAIFEYPAYPLRIEPNFNGIRGWPRTGGVAPVRVSPPALPRSASTRQSGTLEQIEILASSTSRSSVRYALKKHSMSSRNSVRSDCVEILDLIEPVYGFSNARLARLLVDCLKQEIGGDELVHVKPTNRNRTRGQRAGMTTALADVALRRGLNHRYVERSSTEIHYKCNVLLLLRD